jgi:hypothetical protein
MHVSLSIAPRLRLQKDYSLGEANGKGIRSNGSNDEQIGTKGGARTFDGVLEDFTARELVPGTGDYDIVV